MGTLMPALLKVVLNPGLRLSSTTLPVWGWAGKGAWTGGLVASIPLPSGTPITSVDPMKQTPRKSGAKNSSWRAVQGGGEVCNRSRPCAWGLTRRLPRAGRRALRAPSRLPRACLERIWPARAPAWEAGGGCSPPLPTPPRRGRTQRGGGGGAAWCPAGARPVCTARAALRSGMGLRSAPQSARLCPPARRAKRGPRSGR